MAHPCPVPHCKGEVKTTLLMCREHLDMLPLEEKRKLYAAYNAKVKGGSVRDWFKVSKAMVRLATKLEAECPKA